MKRPRCLVFLAGCGSGGVRLTVECLNLLLATVAVVLTLTILMTEIGRTIRLPNGVSGWLLQRSLPGDWEISWQRIEANLAGDVLLEGIELRGRERDHPLLTVDRLHLDLGWAETLRPGVDSNKRVWLRGLRAFIPPAYSCSGVQEVLLTVEEAHLAWSKQSLRIDTFHGSAGGTRFLVRGDLPGGSLWPQRRGAPQQPLEPIGWYHLLARFQALTNSSSGLLRLEPTVAGSHAVTIDLRACLEVPGETGTPDWFQPRQAFVAASLRFDRLPQAKLQLNHARASITFASRYPSLPAKLRELLPLPPNRLFLSSAGAPAIVNLQHKSLRLQLPNALSLATHAGDSLPIAVRLHASQNGESVRATLHAASRRSFLGLHTRLPKWSKLTDRLAWQDPVDVNLSLDRELAQPFLELIPQHRILRDCHAQNLTLCATAFPAELTLDGTLQSDGLFIGQTSFLHTFGHFELNPRQLLVRDGHVQKDATQFAQGSYRHAFQSRQFAMYLRGSLFPRYLDGFLGPWWPAIFHNMSLDSAPLADVAVWGFWGQPNSICSVTAVDGKSIQFYGVPIPALTLQIRNNGNWTLLESLVGRFASGHIRGSVHWDRRFGPDSPWQGMRLDLSGNADWASIRRFTGDPGPVEFTAAPVWSLRGMLWQDRRLPPDAPISSRWWPQLVLSGRDPAGALHFDGWKLQRPVFRVEVDGPKLVIPQLSGLLGDGVFRSSLRIDDWGSALQHDRSIQYSLIDAHFGRVVEQFNSSKQLRPKQPLAEPQTAPPAISAATGRLFSSGQLAWSGHSTHPSGRGDFRIRNGELGGFRLLGFLSRLLGDLGLGFTTLSLSEADLAWQLQAGVLQLTNASLRGNVLQLQVGGEYRYVDDLLDLQLDVSLFSGVFSRLLAPLSRNFSVSVTGPWQQPNYSVSLRPFRWFQDQLSGSNGL